ncbi:MAG: hypothetical protein KAS05_02340 [Candidatus Omnitrophica bacterium]|nr:hypothetical protein [Candidatus Omnitrophota bacterium]
MRKGFLVLSLLVLCSFCNDSFASDEDVIEIDLIKNQVRIIDVNFGTSKINGEFAFKLDRDNGSLILEVDGTNLNFLDRCIPWIRTKLIIKGNIISIPYTYLPQFAAKGEIDLAKNELSFDLEGVWEEKSAFLDGEVKIKIKAWGGISSFLTSGYLIVDGGIYKGKEFNYLRIDFLGRLPVLNINDSQLILKNGNVIEIKGVLDLRDFSNILPGAEYSPQKVFIDQWQLFSGENESVGLKKKLDDKIDVIVDTDGGEEGAGPQTELRYKWKDDQFFKLKMEEEGTSLRIEKRRDF